MAKHLYINRRKMYRSRIVRFTLFHARLTRLNVAWDSGGTVWACVPSSTSPRLRALRAHDGNRPLARNGLVGAEFPVSDVYLFSSLFMFSMLCRSTPGGLFCLNRDYDAFITTLLAVALRYTFVSSVKYTFNRFLLLLLMSNFTFVLER